MDKKREIYVHNYAVMFLDLLSQKERIATLPKVVPIRGLQPELERAVQDTYGATFKLRETIKSYFNGEELGEIERKLREGLTDKQRSWFDKTAPSKTHLQYMGDAIVLYSRLTNKRGEPNLRSIYMMLGGCALAMLQQTARGNPIRGAIEIGVGMDREEFGIYGSAFYSAYFLENSLAKYPRVLVGKELLKYLQLWEKENKADETAIVNKEIARRCLSIVCRDTDGRSILDFLSPEIPKIFGRSAGVGDVDALRKRVKEGYDFVNAEYKRFMSKNNSELAFRYLLLREYYISRKNFWVPQGETQGRT